VWFLAALAVAIAQVGLTAVCAALSNWPFVLRVPTWTTIGAVPLAAMWVVAVYADAQEMLWAIVILACAWILTVVVLTIIRLLPFVRWRLVHVYGATNQRPLDNKRYSLLQLFVMITAIAVALSLALQLLPPSWDSPWDSLRSPTVPRSIVLMMCAAAAAVTAAVHVVLAVLLLSARRWLAWLGLGIYAVAVPTLWACSDVEGLLVYGTWLTSFVATLLAARARGIRLVRERHAARRAADAPYPTTLTQQLISAVRDPAIVALVAVSTLYLWLHFSGALLTCRFVLAGYADQNGRGSIVGLDFKNVPAEKLRLAGVGSLGDVTTLNLNDSGISDDELRHIKDLTRLEELYLSSTKITDEGLEHLKALENLEVLYLDSTRITDDGLSHLKNLTRLRVLSVTDTAISDAGLQHLHAQQELENLSLGGSKTTLAGVCHLGQHVDSLSYVSEIRFVWTGDSLYANADFSPDEMRLLEELGVRELCFMDGQMTQDACEVLPSLSSVEEVTLLDVGGAEVAVRHVAGMKALRKLHLLGDTVDDDAVVYVADLRQLKHLSLGETAVTSRGFQRLASLSGLTSLWLEGSNVTDDVMRSVGRLTSLETLTLADTSVRDVSPLTNLPKLKRLTLPKAIQAQDLVRLREKLPDCRIDVQ